VLVSLSSGRFLQIAFKLTVLWCELMAWKEWKIAARSHVPSLSSNGNAPLDLPARKTDQRLARRRKFGRLPPKRLGRRFDRLWWIPAPAT
jgi:hypothetical protein